MDTTHTQPNSGSAGAAAKGPWILTAAGVILFHLAWLFQGDEGQYWLPGLGLGIALVFWLGWRVLPFLAIDLLIVRFQTHGDRNLVLVVTDASLHVLLIGVAWWVYQELAHGSRWLDDPRSATVFLILIPGMAAAAAILQTSLYTLARPDTEFWMSAASFWLSRITGILVVVPFAIIVFTPILLQFHLLDLDLPPGLYGEREGVGQRLGDWIELAGLSFAASLLALVFLWTHIQENLTIWMLWISCLVLIVWTCIRQGVRGGCIAAGVTAAVVLGAAQELGEASLAVKSAIQGNLLAGCSSALLVGVSASWIRANETRYRQVVSRIPFVVYSVRLPHGVPALIGSAPRKPKTDPKIDLHSGDSISKLANVVLVSPACKQVFGCAEDDMIGPFPRWLDQIMKEDHELVIAALTQLCLQKQPVICEYRLRVEGDNSTNQQPARFPVSHKHRWMRDTLTPHYSEDGLMDGWEGLVEDITEQRALSQNLRRMTNMLEVLVTNLPTGVYFIQAPKGYPILVNARARQLLGRREDLSSGVENLSKVFRLHRPDGSEYPWEELPVAKALLQGIASRVNDVVVHRLDGRKVPLISWAAPVDLHNSGSPDAAVWVIEDFTAMQQAEVALRESELRLRAIIETLAEGVIVQEADGKVVDGNASACAILGISRDQLLARVGLTGGAPCCREDRSPLSRDQEPDWQALKSGQATRHMIIGLPGLAGQGVRWLLVNALPLRSMTTLVGAPPRTRLVTTFADITQQIETQDQLRLTLDKYQHLVDTLPFMLLQRDTDFVITYLNPAATQLTGHSAEEMMRPDFCERIIHPDDLPRFKQAAQAVGRGEATRIEARFYAKDQSIKSVLAFFHPTFDHGQVVGSTSLVVDITMQRRLEAELEQVKHLELVGRLASGTVHDFNNLVQILMGEASIAKVELAQEHPIWQRLDKIEIAGTQASHLAGQILTFSKGRSLVNHPVDVKPIIQETLRLIKSALTDKVAVEVHLDPALPLAMGDEGSLKQVLMNLCLNARDAMSSGGTLTIRADATSPPAGFAPMSEGVTGPKATWVHLSVHDTGVGMAEEVRRRVFEPFFSTKKRGTGLGLAVVHHIVKELGGVIDVWSQPGAGTRFDLWLPQARSE